MYGDLKVDEVLSPVVGTPAEQDRRWSCYDFKDRVDVTVVKEKIAVPSFYSNAMFEKSVFSKAYKHNDTGFGLSPKAIMKFEVRNEYYKKGKLPTQREVDMAVARKLHANRELLKAQMCEVNDKARKDMESSFWEGWSAGPTNTILKEVNFKPDAKCKNANTGQWSSFWVKVCNAVHSIAFWGCKP